MLGLAFAVLNVYRLRCSIFDFRADRDLVLDGPLSQFIDQLDLWWEYECNLGFVFLSALASLMLMREGLITAGTCNLCIAASLAEFLSAYPT